MFVFLKEVITDGYTIVYRFRDARIGPIPKLIEFYTLISINAAVIYFWMTTAFFIFVFHFWIKAKWNFVLGRIICSI